MTGQTKNILRDIDHRGVATITLNRPEFHNAFDDILLAELHQAIKSFADNRKVKVVVLAANGKSFCAGADLGWMQRMAGYSEAENYNDARAMAEFYADLAMLPKPTICAVQGAAFGGGVGLVAACDIAVAVELARFAISEVKVGIIPAVISPYLERALGPRNTRYLALTGDTFSTIKAQALGLVQVVAENGKLQAEIDRLTAMLLTNGPEAMAAVKKRICGWQRDDLRAVGNETARAIAEIRVSAEGREGLTAFLAKRKPSWRSE
ncbi:enoyl-CoA hydratase-related protein [Desulfopila aestuarii]|uniref:Methylglutaconyl-CoA hydratase n=1 Tax=Desulfopila aestuarii DSM 18488 TaxID=1121416 RepID=A0A1M7Y5S0_9BACT|nr:enoyl-CoA hydratase-related protein [Desulfopila aestuarii]SHO47821.1 methylglutaconyl-CoA hydratase [Desulfopila aestuarii DSM 18488]